MIRIVKRELEELKPGLKEQLLRIEETPGLTHLILVCAFLAKPKSS